MGYHNERRPVCAPLTSIAWRRRPAFAGQTLSKRLSAFAPAFPEIESVRTRSPRGRFERHPPTASLARDVLGTRKECRAGASASLLFGNDQIWDPRLGSHEGEALSEFQIAESDDVSFLFGDQRDRVVPFEI